MSKAPPNLAVSSRRAPRLALSEPDLRNKGAVRKAIETLQQQSCSYQSALDTLTLMRLGLVEEFEALKVRYPAEIAKLDQQIHDFQRDLEESKAAALELERVVSGKKE